MGYFVSRTFVTKGLKSCLLDVTRIMSEFIQAMLVSYVVYNLKNAARVRVLFPSTSHSSRNPIGGSVLKTFVTGFTNNSWAS